jgi:hypothetical protein
MYYDIFGNSEYFRPESKLSINSFKEIFQHLDALKDSAIKKPAYLDSLENKLTFLELTTSDFVRKFNDFASNQASLTDPAKHTSFLDTIVHFQFAMILVGMEHAELNREIKKRDRLAEQALMAPEKINDTTINRQIYTRTCEYYNTPIYNKLIAQFKNQDDFIGQLKKSDATLYETLKSRAIEELDAGRKKWRANEKPIANFAKDVSRESKNLKPMKKSIDECLNTCKITMRSLITPPINCPPLIEAKKILDTFDFVVSGQALHRKLLFGVAKLQMNTVDYPGYIDFIFDIMFYHININQYPNIKLNPVNLTTPHTEMIFLTTEIETKLLALQNLIVPRKSFPKKCPQILFAYILNLLLFTLLFKDSQRSSVLGLDTKTWNAQLRLICPFLTVFFDNTQTTGQFPQIQRLKEHFQRHWADDYFNNGISPKIPSPVPVATQLSLKGVDENRDADWDESDDEFGEADA